MDLESLNIEINKLTTELGSVFRALEEAKKKEVTNREVKNEALLFIEKTEKVIQLAEEGKIVLQVEQKEKLIKTLIKIQKLFQS
jgi:hypothetical protein